LPEAIDIIPNAPPLYADVIVRNRTYADIVTGIGAVRSVNGQTGAVLLDHEDVGADPEGAAAAALAAALLAIEALDASDVGADPAGSAAAAQAAAAVYTDQEAAAALAAANAYTDAQAPALIVLQTIFSTTSISFVDVTTMTATLEAGKKYLIEGFAMCLVPFGGSGSAFQLVMPAGTGRIAGTGNTTDQITRSFTELTATGAFTTHAPNISNGFVRFSGSINVSVTGAFKLQARSIVSGQQTQVVPQSTFFKITEIP
jgi:hypothetical protein